MCTFYFFCMFRYSALDALRLISPDDEYFHCEKCNGELVAESDKLAAEEMGEGDDNARRRRREKLKDMLQKIEVRCEGPLVFSFVSFSCCSHLYLLDHSTLHEQLFLLSGNRLHNHKPHIRFTFSTVYNN